MARLALGFAVAALLLGGFAAWVAVESSRLDPLGDDLAPLVILQGLLPAFVALALGCAIAAVICAVRSRRAGARG